VDEGDGDENTREEKWETHHNKQELPERTKHVVICLAAERERDESLAPVPTTSHAKRMTTSPRTYRHPRYLPHRAAST
jgi:hypothetical protein